MNKNVVLLSVAFKMMFKIKLCTFFCFVSLYASAQDNQVANPSVLRSVRTAVPFLLITPDARSGGMGDAGVALLPDVNSLSNNPSKIAMLEKLNGYALSYTPWMRSLADDMNLVYLSGFHRLNKESVIGTSIRYFSLGTFELNNSEGQSLGEYKPNELAIDFTYAKRFGDDFSLGTTIRYIYSGLFSTQESVSSVSGSNKAFAADVSVFYKSPTYLFNKDAIMAFGLNITNIGTKISYNANSVKDFLPTNLRAGASGTFIIDHLNEFIFALDLNKLLVPSSPLYDLNGNIIAGKNPDRSVPSGIFGSFNDAPGGMSEEIKEVSIATGIEYKYNHLFALRAGYFYESPLKGYKRFLTIGSGLKYEIFNLDLAYIIGNAARNPLATTLRFTLFLNLK